MLYFQRWNETAATTATEKRIYIAILNRMFNVLCRLHVWKFVIIITSLSLCLNRIFFCNLMVKKKFHEKKNKNKIKCVYACVYLMNSEKMNEEI